MGNKSKVASKDVEKSRGEEEEQQKEELSDYLGHHEEEETQNDNEKVKGKRKRKRKQKQSSSSNTTTTTTTTTTNTVAPELQRTLYMEGLPFDCSVENVRQFFSETHGCTDIEDLRLPLWQDTKRLRGYGHIVFASLETAQKALKDVNGQHLQGRYIQLQQAKDKKDAAGISSSAGSSRDQPNGCAKVFVKNLPYNVVEADLQAVFSHCGKIVDPGGVRLARNYMTKEPKGFGYVEFKNPEGALAAVQKSVKGEGIRIQGRRLIVDYDEGRIKGSFRTEDGRNWSKVYGSSKTRPQKLPKIS